MNPAENRRSTITRHQMQKAINRAIRLIERSDVMFTDASREEAIRTLGDLRKALQPKPRN